MKLLSLFLLLPSVASFTPASISSARVSTSLSANELEVGVTAPLGLFDPTNQMIRYPEKFERRRAVERKHG